jgi:hypothetical protein
VLVGVPYVGQVAGAFYQSVVGLLQEHHRKTLDLDVVAVPNAAVHLARDMLVRHFLRGGHDYLVMIDSDQVFHPDCVPRLVSWAVPYVSAMIVTRVGKPVPVAYAYERFEDGPDGGKHYYAPLSEEVWAYLSQYDPADWRLPGATGVLSRNPPHEPRMGDIPDEVRRGLDTALLACDGVGTGMVCLSQECAQRLDPGPGDRYFDWEHGGEDLSFSRRILKAGYTGFDPAFLDGHYTAGERREPGIFMDRGCLVGHLTYYARGPVDLEHYLRSGRFQTTDADAEGAQALAAELEAEEAAVQEALR